MTKEQLHGKSYIEAIERVLPSIRAPHFDHRFVASQNSTLRALEESLADWEKSATLPPLSAGEFRPHLGEIVYPRRQPFMFMNISNKDRNWIERQNNLRSNPIKRMLNALLYSHRCVIWDEIGLQLTSRKGRIDDLSADHKHMISNAIARIRFLFPLIEEELMLVEPYRMGQVPRLFNPEPKKGLNQDFAEIGESIGKYYLENSDRITPFTPFFDLWIKYRDMMDGKFDFFLDYLSDESEINSNFNMLERSNSASKSEHGSTVRILTLCGGLNAENMDMLNYKKIRDNEEIFDEMRNLILESSKIFSNSEFPLRSDLYTEMQSRVGVYKGRISRQAKFSKVFRKIISDLPTTIIGGMLSTLPILPFTNEPIQTAAGGIAGGVTKRLEDAWQENNKYSKPFRAQYMIFENDG